MMYRLLGIFGIILFGFSPLTFGLSFVASVDRTEIPLGTNLLYSITISGEVKSRMSEPAISPSGSDFRVVGKRTESSLKIINGQAESSYSFHYVLQPLKMGKFTIPPAAFTMGGTIFQSNPVTVSVVSKNVQNTPAVKSSSGSDLSAKVGAGVFLDGFLSKDKVYVGEVVLYEVDLYQRVRILDISGVQIPAIPDVVMQDLQRRKDPVIQAIQNQRYYVYEALKKALVPVKAGQFEVPGATMDVVVDLFTGPRQLRSDPLTLQVVELPEVGKPSDFSGVIGDFSLTLDSQVPTSARQNVPLTVRLVLEGEGNLMGVNDLLVSSSDEFKVYKSQIEDELDLVGTIRGKRIFEYIVIPKQSGQLILPKFYVSYFSPKESVYQRAEALTPSLDVEASEHQLDVDIPKPDESAPAVVEPAYLIPDFSLSSRIKPFWATWWFWVIVLSHFSLIGWYLWDRFRGVLKGSRRYHLQQAYDKACQQMEALAGKGDVFQELETVIFDFLESVYGRSFLGFTRDRLSSVLSDDCHLDQAVVDALVGVLDRLNFLAYAPQGTHQGELESVKLDVERVLTAIKEYL